MSKGMPTFEDEEGRPMTAKETERRDWISRFIYLFLLLKEALLPCYPNNYTSMHVFEAAEAESIRLD